MTTPKKAHTSRRSQEPYRWLGAGAVTLGLGVAMTTGHGIALAEPTSDGGTAGATAGPAGDPAVDVNCTPFQKHRRSCMWCGTPSMPITFNNNKTRPHQTSGNPLFIPITRALFTMIDSRNPRVASAAAILWCRTWASLGEGAGNVLAVGPYLPVRAP